MKRRDFLLFAGVTAIASKPATAEITRIGFIQSGSRQENQRLLDAFGENLSALGWTDGNNIAVFDRWAEERADALPAIMKELIGSGVAVLVTAGTPATLAAKRASATLPIILVAVDDPVSLGVAESLGQPGGNATGLCLNSSEVITERLVLLRELVPGLHRLAVIVRHDPGLDQKLQDIRNDAQQKGIEALMLEATTGKMRWEFKLITPPMAGLLSTAGGLVFGGAEEGNFFALDAENGKPLWSLQLGAAIRANPMSFAIDGKQQVAIAAGSALFVFGLP